MSTSGPNKDTGSQHVGSSDSLQEKGRRVMVAALFVAAGGCYFGLPDVDPWDEARDARLYAGPWPVVAHPPCARWCRLAKFVESRTGLAVGDDGGTFASALASVRRWGGVLEHPAWSMAWAFHGLLVPQARGWDRMLTGEWVTEVRQRAYGHRASKATWLLYVGDTPPPILDWRSQAPIAVVGSCSRRGDGSVWKRGSVERLSGRERSATPPAFRDLLLGMARGAKGVRHVA